MSRREAAKKAGAHTLGRVAMSLAAAIVALVAGACDVMLPSAGKGPLVATTREKAVVPVAVVRKKLAAPRLIVEMRRFEPSPDDAVEVLVELKGGAAGPVILGRFGIFPHAKFVAPSPADSQRFQFPISPGNAKLIMEAGTVAVALRGLRGRAEAASIELGGATLELPESEATAPSKGG